jgi:hypothetical protein
MCSIEIHYQKGMKNQDVKKAGSPPNLSTKHLSTKLTTTFSHRNKHQKVNCC